MGVTVTTARFTAPTSAGNKTFTDTNLGGLTPKAVMVVASVADTDGTAEANMACSIGFADDTNEGQCGGASEDGQGSTDTDRLYGNTRTVALSVNSSNVLVATWVSFGTNEVTLNFSSVDSDAIYLDITFFAGTDLSVHVGEADPGDLNVEVDVTGPGFEPDLVFMSCMGHNSSNREHGKWTFGVGYNDGSDTQRCLGWASNNADTTTDPRTIITNNRILNLLEFGGHTVEITNYDSSGFSIYSRDASANGNARIAYMALAFNSAVSVNLRSVDSGTSTGDDPTTGVGFKPQWVMLGLTDCQAENSEEQDADAGSFGISQFTADAELCHSWAEEDGVTTTNCQSLSDDQAINFASGDGTTQHAATHVSMDSDGYTLNYSTADGTARKWFEVSIESEGVTLSPNDATHTHAADATAFSQVHALAADETLHSHAADNTTLSELAAGFVLNLSGGASNADPNASLGSTISSTVIVDAVVSNLFDDVPAAESGTGKTEYRCFYLRNGFTSTNVDSTFTWVSTNTPGGKTGVQIGLGTASTGVSTIEQSIASEAAAPSGVSFSSAPGVANALMIGAISARAHRAIWVKRVVESGASNTTPDNVIIEFRGFQVVN